jgi:hypothetical protein
MTTELPPEMIAVNEAMKMVFGALNAAPVAIQPFSPVAPGVKELGLPSASDTRPVDLSGQQVAAPQTWTECPKSYCQSTMACQWPSECGSKIGAVQTSKRQIDIESAILNVAPFDYLTASEIFAALHRRLELRYETRLNAELYDALQGLSKAFDHLTGY